MYMQILCHILKAGAEFSVSIGWNCQKLVFLRVRMSGSCSVMSDSLRPHRLYPTRLLCPWDSPGKNTGVGCHFLLQRIFPTQGSNLGLSHWGQILYPPSHQGSPVFLRGMFKVCCLKLGNFTWASFHSDESTHIENAF